MELLLVDIDIDDVFLSLFLVTEVVPLGQKRKRAPAKIITKPKKASDTLLNLFLFLLNCLFFIHFIISIFLLIIITITFTFS